MKKTIIAAILTLALLACKKESEQSTEAPKGAYSIRIEAQGNDGNVWYSNEAYYANAVQANSDEFAALTYIGYSGGYYVLDLQNKQTCGIDFSVQWLGKDTTIFVGANATKTIQLPGAPKGNEVISAKPLYTCNSSGGDLPAVEITTPTSLPIKFKGIRWEEIGNGKLKIIFDVAECSGINVFNVQLRIADGTYKNVGVVFPDDTKPNATYTLTINLQ